MSDLMNNLCMNVGIKYTERELLSKGFRPRHVPWAHVHNCVSVQTRPDGAVTTPSGQRVSSRR